ncbi:hypothetical protein [Streptomyces albireticuli]|uniref:Condensation domain-containing protein n=1 Tax=Streptomyces albireticuli TaxID=1940 RepID=A0A2A2DEH0_9ACTN|nr:hypothetical protein [Streptomyces albireticuli]MCD9142794.1 hypothetical protein [Streptomyces albireticuli]MCD9162887.1 hypothetical protein [Streptomyces albireticuli]MCD9192447.1 hypothetical protein [Streptomyces albireticuli]PAU50863.1 hypothetical protein CK936_00265 [Streptomyces albireticuli]
MTPGGARTRLDRIRARSGAARLNPTDEMLLGAERSLGSSRVVQVLWRLPAPVSPEALREEWHRLDRGRLSRRPVPAGFPGGRRVWVPAPNTEPPRHHAAALTDATVPDWLDEQVRAPLPAGSSTLWRLAAAPYGAGALVSLTVPHFRSDGLGIFTALGAEGPVPACRAGGAPGAAARELAGWAARTLADREERSRLVSALRTAPGLRAAGSAPRFFTTAFFDLDAAAWEERARARGGTANSLFVEIAANLVRARVPRAGRAPLRVGIPMDLRRGPGDERANALVVVPLEVPAGEPQHTDLRRTRLETKDALAGSGEHSTTLVPERLWHLLPGRYAARLKAPGSQATDVVASNFGELPEHVTRFAGQRADRTALRTMNVPGVVPERAGLRASLCLVRTGERLTVTVTGMPDHFGDARSLRDAVTEEFAAWGLRAEAWWTA